MKYQVQKHENSIVLVEQRNDEIPPVILDTVSEDQSILEQSLGEIMNEDDFVLEELPIEGYRGQFQTVARLIIDDAIRAKLA
jgi:hypothetical protein